MCSVCVCGVHVRERVFECERGKCVVSAVCASVCVCEVHVLYVWSVRV